MFWLKDNPPKLTRQHVAGRMLTFIAEKIHTGRNNNNGASSDFSNWIDSTLLYIPEKLSKKYQSFLLEYTKDILLVEINWVRITAIAEALLERKTLNYDQVWDVIRERLSR